MNISKVMESGSNIEPSHNAIRILKGSGISAAITLIGLLAYSGILTFTSLGENTMNPVVIILVAISILIGSGITTSKIRKMGLLNGGLVGLIYIGAIYLISSITGKGFSLNTYSTIVIIASIIAGMLGGIIGVNRK